MKLRRAQKILRRLGYRRIRSGGHQQWRQHDTGRMFTLVNAGSGHDIDAAQARDLRRMLKRDQRQNADTAHTTTAADPAVRVHLIDDKPG